MGQTVNLIQALTTAPTPKAQLPIPVSRFFLQFFQLPGKTNGKITIFATLFVPRPERAEDGWLTYRKALSQRLICGTLNLANSEPIRTVRQCSMSMVCIFRRRCAWRMSGQTGFLIIRSDIHNSVGFGIAYPRMVGDARA